MSQPTTVDTNIFFESSWLLISGNTNEQNEKFHPKLTVEMLHRPLPIHSPYN